MAQIIGAQPAPLFRIAAAMVYDAFLIVGLMIAAGFAFTAANGFKPVAGHSWLQHALTACLLIIWCGFYMYFCPKQGQTLGMRAWKLIMIDAETQKPPKAGKVFLRWACAVFMSFAPAVIALAAGWLNVKNDGIFLLVLLLAPALIGYSCAWFDAPQKRSIPDRLTGTRIVQAERNPCQKTKAKFKEKSNVSQH